MIGEFQERPWGSWEVLDEGYGYKVKRIVVNSGCRLSYQTHEHRAEHWTVVVGRATCLVDGQTVIATPGQSVDIQTGQAHRIANSETATLVIIEVQLGAYTGEDDICRLEDDYGRTDVGDPIPST